MILVIITAMGACLAIGYLIGWLIGSDRAEARSYPPVAAPVATQPLRLRLHPADPDTGELLALNAAETARFPGLAVQPPLGQLVLPVTDFIEKMRADTDRWLAARGLEDAK